MRANPWKRCAALGLQPGQHAILQVPAPQAWGNVGCEPCRMLCTHVLHVIWKLWSRQPSLSGLSHEVEPRPEDTGGYKCTTPTLYLTNTYLLGMPSGAWADIGVHIIPLHWHRVCSTTLWFLQGHLRVAMVLEAARRAGLRGLGAALDSVCDSLLKGPDAEQVALVDGEPDRIPCTELPKMMELVVEWAAGVLAARNAASAGACGARQGAPAPACKPSFPRTDAWASEAWPGLADVVVALALRSVSARRVLP